MLTAHLEAGQRVQIFPLLGASTELPPGIPSIRQIQEASIIRLKEILIDDHEVANISSGSRDSKRRDWLALLLRETLGWSMFINTGPLSHLLTA